MFTSLRVRKSISRTTSGLTLAIRKISSKNLTWLALSVTEKAETTIPKMSSMVPSIFCAPMSVGLMGSPSFRARVGWMVLTSLPESKSADLDTDFFQKVIRYRIHGTHARFGYSPLLSSSTWPISAVSTASAVPTDSAASTASSLVPVTNVEVAETDTSFLTLVSSFKDNCWHSGPYFCSGSNQLGIGLLLLLWGGVDVRRGWVLAPSLFTPRASVVVLLRVGGGSLLSGRWLFFTRCVSRSGVGGVILSVLLFFLSEFDPSRILWVHVAGIGRKLQQRFYLCIDGFLNGLFLRA